MSKTRQGAEACRALPDPVTALTFELPGEHEIPVHSHPEDQLVYACRGVMTVRTQEGTWVVPPLRAVWIPARVPHAVATSGAVSMRTLYLRAGLVRRLRGCRVVNVSPLLRELILHACRLRALTRRKRDQAHLVDAIVDQLDVVESTPLQLPSPADARAARVAEILSADPGGQRSLEEICRAAGASRRTIERLFRSETPMTLGEWRQQLRLLTSLRLLAAGKKITHVALESGYATASAFIAMFRRALGTTPRRYFDDRGPKDATLTPASPPGSRGRAPSSRRAPSPAPAPPRRAARRRARRA
ncbi:MAG TPA: helix-turn-helix transcriptional regulator [Thermoanaerobaculia bacterium]|nr:helix-turn-helix transcriptional regulator [Thermoanaerobaculia bacterium]